MFLNLLPNVNGCLVILPDQWVTFDPLSTPSSGDSTSSTMTFALPNDQYGVTLYVGCEKSSTSSSSFAVSVNSVVVMAMGLCPSCSSIFCQSSLPMGTIAVSNGDTITVAGFAHSSR
jgi:hypothetical protein